MLGRRIRSYRIKNHFTQKEVAIELGIKKSTVTAWEAGILHPTDKEIKQLSILFCVSPLILKGFDNYYSLLEIVPCNEKTQTPTFIMTVIGSVLLLIGLGMISTLIIVSLSFNKTIVKDLQANGVIDIISKAGGSYFWIGLIFILISIFFFITSFLLKHIKVRKKRKR